MLEYLLRGPRRGAAARRAGQLPRRARQDLARAADPRVGQDDPVHQPRPRAARPTPRPGSSPSSWAPAAATRVWTHPGGFASYHEARRDRFARFEELRRRWDEEHAKIKALVLRLQDQGGVQRRHGLAVQGRADPAPQVRGGRAADRAAARAAGARCGSRAAAPASARWCASDLELDRADAAVRPRGLVRRAGRRARLATARASRTSCGCSPPAAPTPTSSTGRSTTTADRAGRATPARPSSAPGCARAGSCRPTSTPSWSAARCWRSCTAATAARRPRRDGPRGRPPGCSTATSSRTPRSRRFESLSGGQQARFQILLLELSGRDAAAARRADRQPRRAVGRGARGRPRGVRGHRRRGHPRPLVRPRLRPVPGLRRRRRRSTSPTGRSGTRRGSAAPAERIHASSLIRQRGSAVPGVARPSRPALRRTRWFSVLGQVVAGCTGILCRAARVGRQQRPVGRADRLDAVAKYASTSRWR